MTRAILESSPYGIFVVNNEFTIDYMNPTMLRMSSEEDEVVTGSSIHDISDYRNAGITDRIEETITSVSNFFLGPVEFTSPADGGTAFRNFLGFPLVDDSSIKALVFVEDVTERMRIEAQNALLAASVESAEEAFFITDAEGTIQYVNPAFERITGYHKGDVLSRKPSILKSGRHDEAFYRSLWEKLNRGEVWHGIFINKKKDGTLYEAETTIFPVKSSSGKILNFVASKRDVTEKNRLEAIAEAVNTMNNIGYIFTGIRHEIGNPINS
ncbi:MAG: PAS domain S-box protein, partial [Nitrospirota bacterium]|nr:PAS domain S-box protein [Nitrospirota bacterium]